MRTEGSLWSSQSDEYKRADKRAFGIHIMWDVKKRRQVGIGQKKKTTRIMDKQGTKDSPKKKKRKREFQGACVQKPKML